MVATDTKIIAAAIRWLPTDKEMTGVIFSSLVHSQCGVAKLFWFMVVNCLHLPLLLNNNCHQISQKVFSTSKNYTADIYTTPDSKVLQRYEYDN